MITIDNDGVMKLADKLEKMSGRAIPYATRSALNKAAFFARGEAQEVIGRNMIERNKWTRRSVMVQTAKGLNINKQESEVGSVQDYMETQEYGGTVTGRGKTKPIPTGYAAGQDGQRKRTKVPTRVNKMRNIRVGSRNRRNTLFQSTRGETKATRLWERYYCMSLVHLGMVDKRAECESMVASMGWPFALEKWGTARARHSNTVPICNNSTNLDDYRVEFKGPCDTGVFLDVWNGLEWVPTYFFKDDVCKDTQFVLHESEHPLLFEGSKIQFRQCDDVENVECVSNRCTPKAGVYISAEYMSVEARLIRLYNEGRLCECSDDTCTPFKK